MIKTYFHKLGRIGGQKTSSLYVTLPSDLIAELGWAKGGVISIKRAGKQRRLVLEAHEPWHKKLP